MTPLRLLVCLPPLAANAAAMCAVYWLRRMFG